MENHTGDQGVFDCRDESTNCAFQRRKTWDAFPMRRSPENVGDSEPKVKVFGRQYDRESPVFATIGDSNRIVKSRPAVRLSQLGKCEPELPVFGRQRPVNVNQEVAKAKYMTDKISLRIKRMKLRKQKEKENAQQETIRLKKLFSTWRDHARVSQIESLKMLVAVYHYESGVYQEVFFKWKLTLLLKKWERSCRHWRLKTIGKVLLHWKLYLELANKVRVFEQDRIYKQVGRVFGDWVGVFREKKRRKEIGSAIEMKRLKITKRIILKDWHTAYERSIIESKLKCIGNRLRARDCLRRFRVNWECVNTCRRGLKQWRRYVHMRNVKRNAVQLCIFQLELLRKTNSYKVQIFAVAFSKWKKRTLVLRCEHVMKWKQIENEMNISFMVTRWERFFAIYARVALRYKLVIWSRWASHKTLLRERETILKYSHGMNMLRGSFGQWVALHRREKAFITWGVFITRAVLQEKLDSNRALDCRHKILHFRRNSFFKAWKLHAKALGLNRQHKLESCFRDWIWHVSWRRIQFRVAVNFYRRQSLRLITHTWRAYVYELARESDATRFYERKLLAMTMKQWYSFSRYSFLLHAKNRTDKRDAKLGWFARVRTGAARGFHQRVPM
mmetsp:Transcript_42290/g.67707  ORF Transcript_42290/g.67707 Transcript_42290/m.67707 type:complete len:615 (+) Transcript_42290:506-2350(+)